MTLTIPHAGATRSDHVVPSSGIYGISQIRAYRTEPTSPSPKAAHLKSHNNANKKVNDMHLFRCIVGFVWITLIWVSHPNVLAQGQTEAVLVSNWSQSVNATSMVDDERLQTFTTGSHVDGYLLTRIELDFVLTTSIKNFTVHLWTTQGNRPGNRIAILETQEVAVGEPTEFTPSSPVVLNPDTQYFLHIAVTNPENLLILKATKSGSEDRSFGATTWLIADDSIHIPNNGTSNWITESNVLKIRIFGNKRNNNVSE